jgi:hypothetical protein
VNGALDPHVETSRPKIASERKFGLAFATLFAAIALWPMLRGREVHLWAAAVACVLLAVTLVSPRVLAPLNRIWFEFGVLLGKITSPLILGLVFCVVITPIALLMRGLGKDPLRLKRRPQLNSYLIERSPRGTSTLREQF